MEFPDFSLTFLVFKISLTNLQNSLTLKKNQISLTFPWPEATLQCLSNELTFWFWNLMDSHPSQSYTDFKLVGVLYGTAEREMFWHSSRDHQGIVEEEQAIHWYMLVYSDRKTNIQSFYMYKIMKLQQCKQCKWRLFELPRDKTNKMACASSEDSDQPGHLPSLISLHCALNR